MSTLHSHADPTTLKIKRVKPRRRIVAAEEGQDAKSRKRSREAVDQAEEAEVFNAPLLKPKLLEACDTLRRPAKRRRLRSQLRAPEAWESFKKQIFRVRELPEICKATFITTPLASSQAGLPTAVPAGGGIFTSSPSSAGSGSTVPGASAPVLGASSGNIFAASSSSGSSGSSSGGGIFSAPGGKTGSASSGSSIFAASSSGGSSAFGASSIFAQGSGPAGTAFGAASSAQSGPSMFAQAFQQSRPGPGGARRRRR